MKKSILMLVCMLFALTLQAKKSSASNDTIGIDQREITKWIEEPYTKSDGKKGMHYYAIWRGFLLNTSKTTIEKANLCTKYGARCALIVIGQRQSNGSFKPKRITTN